MKPEADGGFQLQPICVGGAQQEAQPDPAGEVSHLQR